MGNEGFNETVKREESRNFDWWWERKLKRKWYMQQPSCLPSSFLSFFVILRTLLMGTLLDLPWIQDSTQVYPKDSTAAGQAGGASVDYYTVHCTSAGWESHQNLFWANCRSGAWWGGGRKSEPQEATVWLQNLSSSILIRLINWYILVTCRETLSNLGLHHVSCKESVEDIIMLIWPFF